MPLEGYSEERLMLMLGDVISKRFPLRDVVTLIQAGANVSGKIKGGLRPLHYAAYENNIDCIAVLLDAGANPNDGDDIGYTALHVACKCGYYESAKELIRGGADVNFFSRDSVALTEGPKVLEHLVTYPLMVAIEFNCVRVVELLLLKGANPNQQYFLGHEINIMPLENTDCLELLLEFGAGPDRLGRNNQTPLMKACKQQNVEAATILIKHKADVNKQCPPKTDQKRALHFVAKNGNVTLAKLLLQNGAETGVPPNLAYSPVEFAMENDQVDVFRVMVEHGADVHELNEDKCTLLQLACATTELKNQKEFISILCSHHADVNYSSPSYNYRGASMCPLVEYLRNQQQYDYNIVQLLLQYGAKVNMTLSATRFKIYEACGVLGEVRKLRNNEDIFLLLLDNAYRFNVEQILVEPAISSEWRDILLEEASTPRSLKQLVRMRFKDLIRFPYPERIGGLPLPPFLKQYLMCEGGYTSQA